MARCSLYSKSTASNALTGMMRNCGIEVEVDVEVEIEIGVAGEGSCDVEPIPRKLGRSNPPWPAIT